MTRSVLGLALAATALLSPVAARADGPPEPRKNAVQADVGLSVIFLAYERVLADRVALQVGGGAFGIWWADPKFIGWGGEVRSSFFLTGRAPHGLYLAPFVRVDTGKTTKNGASAWGYGSAEGAFVGYSFVILDRLNVRIGTGAQYMHYVATVAGERVEWKKPYPCLDGVVGYEF